MDKIFASMFGLIGLSVLIGAYFAPTIVAGMRRHHQLGAIAVTNLFVGWTVIGWVVAMATPPTGTAPLWLYQTPHREPPQERSA
jgi:hypothetical protein